MSIKITKEDEKVLIASIQRYFTQNMENDIGNLQATLLLDFILKEIGPSIYNQAVSDAQRYMQDKVSDLDANCYEIEFGYWKKN